MGGDPVNGIHFISTLCCTWTLALLQNSYFPIKTTAGANGLTKFESEWYGKSLERMNEPRLCEVADSVKTDTYRLTILPTWGNSIAVRVQKQGDFYHLSARRLDGQAGYHPGSLVESKDVELDAEDSRTLGTLIQNLNFFQLATKDDVRGMDGDEWIIEGVAHGKYHAITRWCAPSSNPDKRRLRPFLALCTFLVDKSTLSARPMNDGHKLI
jgi:hypothetical protein